MIILTLIGILILLAPFLLISKFQNRIQGFVTILSILIFFQLLISLITQTLKIFNYPTILIIHIIGLCFLFYKFKLNKKDFKINFKKIDWILILIILIIFTSLFFVHFNYTGKYNVVGNSQYLEAQNMVYPYPYFSDEWYAVSLIEYSINSNSLPTKTSLTQNNFLNLELAFHSFLALNFLLLNLNPLTNYVIISILLNLLICILIYLFLKEKINPLVAAITAVSTIYITNGANLSGLWNLIPINLGILSFILTMFFFSYKNTKMILLTGFLTLLFYPPLAIFFILIFLINLFYDKKLKKEEIKKQMINLLIIITISALIVSLAYFIFNNGYQGFFKYLISKLFYTQYTGNFIPQYKIQYIIPIWTLIFSIIGTFYKFKEKKWLYGTIFFSLIYWIIYSYTTKRFIIDYTRLVLFTSILITISSGFGLQFLIENLKKIKIKEKHIKIILITTLLLFLVLTFNYTRNENWMKLIAKDSNQRIAYPASPANKYLTSEDLEIFQGLENITFLSWPWKGTVIGVATKNIPLSTKAGTITISQELFYEFMNSNCENKLKLAKDKKINYIYSPRFNCNGFVEKRRSKENLILYKVEN